MGSLIDIMPDSGSLLRTVLDQFRKVGQRGATVDEIADMIGVLHQRVSPTVSSLKRSGMIGPKGLATRPSACGAQMTVYVLTMTLIGELRSAGYAVFVHCQCEGYGCKHSTEEPGVFHACESSATELVQTPSGRSFELCLECAVNFPSNNVSASRSIGAKA